MKKCLLITVIALASIVARGQVYSENVMGYVNITTSPGYSLLANPLSAGITNGANELMPVQDGAVFLTFVDGHYHYYGYDSGYEGWIDAYGTQTSPPRLPPGQGFWCFNPAATAQTITFVGEVIPRPGTTNVMSLPAGYSLIGTPMAVSEQLGRFLTSGNPPVPGSVNMPIADGMVILSYIGGHFDYDGYDSGSGGWISQEEYSYPPTILVGHGYFYFNPLAGPINWLQTLP